MLVGAIIHDNPEIRKGDMTLQAKPAVFRHNARNRGTPCKPVKILLVDDYDANILITGTYLEYLGMTYDVATNGFDAVRQVIAHQYAAILMDINMPDMDGIEATSLIRQLEKDSGRERQPIIAFSAHPGAMEESIWCSWGMDCAITKPFQQSRFEQLIAKYVPINGHC